MNIDSPITMPHSIASRYEVLECIGQGGMGLVYRGIGLEDNREVAIKVIDPKHLTEPGCRRGFIREARAILRLRHPNVVELIDFDAPH
ncbi:MAG: serine/threonine protein kinase, partial [Deltaproteobacteria bacterium CG17_big_fil_post_rev_8_21_14_2_50_63_7]